MHVRQNGRSSARSLDDNGMPLSVQEDLGATEHIKMKEAAYKRAIAAWNRLDKSNRKRITPPVVVTLTSTSTDESTQSGSPTRVDSMVVDCISPTPMTDRWVNDLTF